MRGFPHALTAIIFAASLGASPAMAQENSAGETEQMAPVTGTRIGRVHPLYYAEITLVTSEQIEMSGVTNIEQLLTQLPTFTLQGQKTSHPEGLGIVTVDLRNLGPGRNLVLINGHRIVGAGGPTVDLSVIPVSAIDRVEVFHGGASAIYGADAMAGVVNIIMKKDFDGFEVKVHGGTSTEWDSEKIGISTTMGTSNEKGNVMLTFDWSHRSPVYHRDREWAYPPCHEEEYGFSLTSCGSTTLPGGYVTNVGVTDPSFNIDYPSGIAFFSPEANWTGMWSYGWWDSPPQPPPFFYEWANHTVLSGQSDKFHLVANGHYDLGKNVTAYMDGFFTYNRHGRRYPGAPVRITTNYAFGPYDIHLSNPFIPDDFWEDIIEEYKIDYEQPYIYMEKRTNDIGARVFETGMSTFRAVVGLKGEITPNYNWDLFINYSRFIAIDVTKNIPDMQRYHTAIDPDLCYSTPGCILANMFGEGTMQGDVREFIGYDATETKQWDSINSGAHFLLEPFDLQGGRFAAVIGGDIRFERGATTPDSKDLDGLSALQTEDGYSGSYNTQDAFLELSAPFLGGLPGADMLTLDLAGRISHFNTSHNSFSYRAGLTYGPIKDIKLRGSISSALRAPGIAKIAGPSHTSFPAVSDPCSNLQAIDPSESAFLIQQCQAEGVPPGYFQDVSQVRTIQGANPHLEPEISRTVKVGTVITPTFMPRSMPLVMTFDWYNIKIFDAFDNMDAQRILRNCYEVEGLQEYCQYVLRNPDTGALEQIYSVLGNINEIHTSGFDFTFNLGFPIFRNIKGNFGFMGNILGEFKEANPDDLLATEDEDVADSDSTGLIYRLESGFPKCRLSWSLSLGDAIWQLDNTVRYISGMEASENVVWEDDYKMSSVVYWDMSGKLSLSDFDLIVGVQNLLDKEPPYFPETGYNANIQVYDLIGRYIFANVGYEFH